MNNRTLYNPKVCIRIGLLINIALTGFKFIAGILGLSRAMIADALHSFSDILTSVSVHSMSRQPDFVQDNESKSVLTQKLTLERYLPVKPIKPHDAETLVDYIYEQPPEEIFGVLLDRYVEIEVYR